MEEHERSVADIVTGKLRADQVPEQVAALILDALRKNAPDAGPMERPPAAIPSRVYLKSIAVEGFRGIGPKATLFLTPGPGLTVVTGRNGSGKSSFAEAAELALTGENKRWADRSAVWKEGWRNLHAPDPTAISVQLAEDGVPGTTTVTRAWATGAGLDSADDAVWIGATELSLAAKGWLRPLELYRPFLSYAELGALVSGKPTSMHDAMQAILGLDLLTATEKTLTDERRTADAQSKAAKQQRPPCSPPWRPIPMSEPAARSRRSPARPGTCRPSKRWPSVTVPGLRNGSGFCDRSRPLPFRRWKPCPRR